MFRVRAFLFVRNITGWHQESKDRPAARSSGFDRMDAMVAALYRQELRSDGKIKREKKWYYACHHFDENRRKIRRSG